MPPQLVGINHVALEVADLDRSLAFYGRLFELRFRGRSSSAAFVDIGDQFLALMQGVRNSPTARATSGSSSTTRRPSARAARGRRRAPARTPARLPRPGGNRIEIVQYRRDPVHEDGRGAARHAAGAGKTDPALAELREKGLAGIIPGGHDRRPGRPMARGCNYSRPLAIGTVRAVIRSARDPFAVPADRRPRRQAVVGYEALARGPAGSPLEQPLDAVRRGPRERASLAELDAPAASRRSTRRSPRAGLRR